MKVTYETFARFVEIFGREGELAIEPGATLYSVLKQLSGTDEGRQKMLFDDAGSVRKYVIILRNKERIPSEKIQNEPVDDGDVITIYPPVSGG